MSDWTEQMRQAADRTAPSGSAVDRTRARIGAGLEPTTELLKSLPEPSGVQVARVRARLGERRRRLPWLPLGAAAALAAAALVWVGLPTDPVPVPEPPIHTVDLAAGGSLGAVRVEADGLGQATGADTTWELDWRRGRIRVEVPHDGAHDVTLRTPEAEVRVVGTVFVVERDALGTAVHVERGEVTVRCGDGGVEALAAKAPARTCLPTTAAGLLGRARSLEGGGASPEVVLEAVDRGLERDSEPSVRGELLATRVGSLVALERRAEALDAAEAYLAIGGPRAEPLRSVAAALALGLDGCDRALPHLEALSQPTTEERAALDRCSRP